MKLVILHICVSINICLLYLPYISFCADRQYEVCKKARYCGNQSIRFPFYTEKNSEYCGFPGFELTCLSNNVLLLNISEDQYTINEVFYANNSFRVSNILSSRSGFCRLDRIRNLSLPSDRRFELLSTSSLILLSKCASELEQKLSRNKVGCDLGKNDPDWVLAMKTEDSDLVYATEVCASIAVAPIRNYSEDDRTDYLRLIRNGFDLKWMVSECSDCEASGGYCGYEREPVNKFKCLCSDRPHSRRCNGRFFYLVVL